MAQGEDDPLGSFFIIVVVVVVVVVVTAGGAPVHAAAGAAPDANKGEPRGAHHGNSFVLGFMAACVWGCASSWWPRRRSRKDECQALRVPWPPLGRLPARARLGKDAGHGTSRNHTQALQRMSCVCVGGRRGA
jgi:hypothetical protein